MKRVSLFLVAVLGMAFAWSPARAAADTRFEYVVKFVCGTASEGFRVVPGNYATSVNIYNPNGGDIVLNKNIALTFPPSEQAAGSVSDVIMDILPSNAALQVDCEEIPSAFTFQEDAPGEAYTEGFLILQATGRLNVSAVYTATESSNGSVSVDVEQIQGAKVRVRADAGKLTICHFPPGNPNNAHTIRIGAPAWPAHAAHGDTQGACNP
jgi:hypothetical protein